MNIPSQTQNQILGGNELIFISMKLAFLLLRSAYLRCYFNYSELAFAVTYAPHMIE